MDFDQLETFLEVARLLNFSRAAEKRFRTQPAISAQVRALEDEVGTRLLDRSGGRVSLTLPGKTFQKYAEQAVEARRSIIAQLAEMERVPRGEIVVAANEASCLHILPEVFAEFKHRYPSVAVSIDRLERPKILESVIDNSADFGVVSLPVDDKRLTVVLIHRDELAVIVPPEHPLARKKVVKIEEVAPFPLVLPPIGRTRDGIENAFQERQLKPNISMELDSNELIKRFVAVGVGLGFMARAFLRDEVRAGTLIALPIADAAIRRDLGLVFRKDKALSRGALAFIDIAVKLKQPSATSAPTSAR